ncbi:hypothetical protein C8039_11805 [Halogeometricum sp. wsp3]|nr:hypothetical protein C8039_11805 [Halogeometricum sp. wsp3]
MPESKQGSSIAHFDVTNIGGIDETSVDIPPSVTVLTGKNATNRTSFLQSIMAAMGSTQATSERRRRRGTRCPSSAAEFDGRSRERSTLSSSTATDIATLRRRPVRVPPRTNEARRSVARGDDLREIIMRPVDIDAIRSEVEQLEAEKGDINDELATVESRQRDLPDLEQRRTELREQIEEKREELAEREEEIDNSSRDIEESRQEQDVLEEKRRTPLDAVGARICRRDIEARMRASPR